ncbi:MAG: NAD-dependent epimerase/dehydratase family protein [Planctomycetota bacterium]
MDLIGRRVFITGGAGFIGSHVARRLADRNRITLYDNFHRDAFSGSALARHPRVRVIRGDVRDATRLRRAVKGHDTFLHMASIAGVDMVRSRPVETMLVNILGTHHLLEAIRANRLRAHRVVDFSTSEVFGTHVYHAEEQSATTLGEVGEARWTYAVSKLAAEHLAHHYGREYGIPVASIRPFNVYGPGQVGVGAIHQFIVRAIRHAPLILRGDGSQIRSWCYIDDMVDGILRVLTRPAAVGKVFNIGNPRATVTIAALAEKIIQLTGSTSGVRYDRRRYVDVELRIPGIDRARRLLGFEPKVGLDEGLLRTIAWYQERERG